MIREHSTVQATWKSRGSNQFSPDCLRSGLRFSIVGFPTGRTVMNDEVWMPISNFESSYEISNLGRVKRNARKVVRRDGFISTLEEKILTPQLDRSTGYYKISFGENRKRFAFSIHRLVASNFVLNKNPINLIEVNHKNAIKTDNRPENLEWVTRSQNVRHAISLNLIDFIRGEDSPSAKLKTNQVLEIRSLFDRVPDRKTLEEMGARYGVDWQSIRSVIRRTTWNHL